MVRRVGWWGGLSSLYPSAHAIAALKAGMLSYPLIHRIYDTNHLRHAKLSSHPSLPPFLRPSPLPHHNTAPPSNSNSPTPAFPSFGLLLTLTPSLSMASPIVRPIENCGNNTRSLPTTFSKTCTNPNQTTPKSTS